jgi:hypothetical protein
MSSALRWSVPDYGAFDTVAADADAEAAERLLVAALRVSADSVGLATTTSTVASWLSMETDTTSIYPEQD